MVLCHLDVLGAVVCNFCSIKHPLFIRSSQAIRMNTYLCTYPRIALLDTTFYICKDKILLTLLSSSSFFSHIPFNTDSYFFIHSSFFFLSLAFFLCTCITSTVPHPYLLPPSTKIAFPTCVRQKETPSHFL